MAAYLDVTVPLVPGRVPVYPGDAQLRVERTQARSAGDAANVSAVSCSTHCGTHVDAPTHFLDGAPGVEALPLDVLIGPAWVADAMSVARSVHAADLDGLGIPAGTERLLLRTSNSALWDDPRFTEDFVALAPDGAEWLARRGVRLVGIDYLSIAPYADPAPVHEVLLRAGVVIVETLDLRAVEPGEWTLICLPLLVPGCDGAPARVVLRRS